MSILWLILLSVRAIYAVNKKDIILYYYNQSSPDTHIYSFNLSDTNEFGVFCDFSKPIVFIVHGWVYNYDSDVDNSLSKAILSRYDVNIFTVTYPFNFLYSMAVDDVESIGTHLGAFIKTMSIVYNYPLSNVKMVGHSLGAHICGIAGKRTGGAMDSIVGLDPAGPLFYERPPSRRLAKTDAKNVEVIHTSDLFGITLNCGKADFYPNGGKLQPGCPEFESCSHLRAIRYYIDSLLKTTTYIGTKCPSYFMYIMGQCSRDVTAFMGGFVPDKKARGSYYLTTKLIL